MEKCLLLCLRSLKSEESRRNYKLHIDWFMKSQGFKNASEILKCEEIELKDKIVDYIIELSDRVNPNSIPAYCNSIKSFLEINDVNLNWRQIKKFYPRGKKNTGQSAYTDEQVAILLEFSTKIRNKAIIHFLASSGVRGGVFDTLSMKDIRDMPYGCKMITVYPDDIEEYKTFLTPEASAALELYLKQRRDSGEIITGDSAVFVKKDGQRAGYTAIEMIVKRVSVKANIRGQKKDNRYKNQVLHAFRKRFNSTLKMNNLVNDNAIEKMMGHKNGLDGTYLQISDERLFEEFYKGVPDLTVDRTQKDQIRIRELEENNSKVNEKMIESLQEQINELRGLTSPKDYSKEDKKIFAILESTKQLEPIPLKEQMKSLTSEQKDLLLLQLLQK